MNIGVDLGSREVMGIFETTIWCLKKFLTPIWLIIPAFMTNQLKKSFSGLNKKSNVSASTPFIIMIF